jgi:RNA polymerase sigma factor (sigma-70 family)
MDLQTQHTIYEEFINRYERLIISRIKRYYSNEELFDLFQDVTLHIYQKIPVEFHKNPDAFSSSSWVVTVVDRFIISSYRKNQAEKNIHSKSDSKFSDHQWEKITSSLIIEFTGYEYPMQDMEELLHEVFKLVSKKDALMLKMKYYYGKSSEYISTKLNISHVNMRIKRVKEHIQLKLSERLKKEIKSKYLN